jgi:hypothetical protein
MKSCVPLTLCLLLLAGNAMGQTRDLNGGEKSYAEFPTGEGDPDAVTCRRPQHLPDSRLNGPEVCKTNSDWAQYRRDGMDVAPDGVHAVPLNGYSGLSCDSVAIPSGASGSLRMNSKCIEPVPNAAHVRQPRATSGTVCTAAMNCS